MVCCINTALRLKVISLRPNDNRWPVTDKKGILFDFSMLGKLPARGFISDAGFGELNVHAAVNPKGRWVMAFNAGFSAGDAFAYGWLERKRGAWLQSSTSHFNCRRTLLRSLASNSVEPNGYGDRGRVIA